MNKLSLIKLSKKEESKILGGKCDYRCSTSGCDSCSGGSSYAFSSGYSYNRVNDNVTKGS
jgi:hypothetical protein